MRMSIHFTFSPKYIAHQTKTRGYRENKINIPLKVIIIFMHETSYTSNHVKNESEHRYEIWATQTFDAKPRRQTVIKW